jgi:PAS domain S-box-containing protein
MIIALDGTAIALSFISMVSVVLVAVISGWFAYKGIKLKLDNQSTEIQAAGKQHAEQAAAVVNAHLDNGLKSTLQQLVNQVTENGTMMNAVIRTQEYPIIQTDPHGSLTNANPAAMKLLGMSLAEMTGDGWARAVHPEDREHVFSTWRHCVVNHCEFGPLVYRYIHPVTKEVTLVEAMASPSINIQNQIVSWVATIQVVEAV